MQIDAPAFDLTLARRLSRPGPRYTSYPTAAQFHDGFGSLHHLTALATCGAERRPLSLYVHIPFCEQLCNYCACHMRVTHRPEKVERYVSYLLREIDLVANLLDTPGEVTQVHWGGGTPNSLTPTQMMRVADHLRARFDLAPDVEMSIECDPRTLVEEHVWAAVDAGFRRLSLGVQTFDERVQKAIGRVQPVEMVENAVDRARAAGFEGVNFDLLYGLPFQTEETITTTMGHTMSMRPDRIALFGYAHVPWLKRHQRLIDASALPSAEERLRQYALSHELLSSVGYEAVGLDHFAQPGDPLLTAQRNGTLHRNFQGYTTRAGADLIGFGVSSISAFETSYSQNVKGLTPYYRMLDEGRLPTSRGVWLSADDRLRRDVIGKIMCGLVVDKGAVETASGISFDSYFGEAIERLLPLQELGVVELAADRVAVTAGGRPFVRNVAMAFDAYLSDEPKQGRYSQTV